MKNIRLFDDILANIGPTFSEMLLKRIYSENMKPSDCYTRANITKQHFSKIQSDRYYKPKKPTVAAFALALKLTLRETEEFMASAGFALSHASRFDLIIEYAITHKIYNVLDVNVLLHKYNEPLLG